MTPRPLTAFEKALLAPFLYGAQVYDLDVAIYLESLAYLHPDLVLITPRKCWLDDARLPEAYFTAELTEAGRAYYRGDTA